METYTRTIYIVCDAMIAAPVVSIETLASGLNCAPISSGIEIMSKIPWLMVLNLRNLHSTRLMTCRNDTCVGPSSVQSKIRQSAAYGVYGDSSIKFEWRVQIHAGILHQKTEEDNAATSRMCKKEGDSISQCAASMQE